MVANAVPGRNPRRKGAYGNEAETRGRVMDERADRGMPVGLIVHPEGKT